jgi:hypothetical protein
MVPYGRTPASSPVDVSAGLKTAALAAERLKGSLPREGQARHAVELFERQIEDLNQEVRSKWILRAEIPETGEVESLRRRVGDMRKRVVEMWTDARLLCEVSGSPEDRGKRPKKRRK